jgi:RNA polymerase sigma factor (sigma-70 family)
LGTDDGLAEFGADTVTDSTQRRRFEAIVLPHLDDALSLARWLTGNHADGEDVLQEAAIRAYTAIASFRDGSPKAWLLMIVRNTAFSWLRKNRPKALLVTDDISVFERAETVGSLAPEILSAEAALIAKADIASVQSAIANLPIAYREMIVLREIDELSYRDIAEVTGLPMGTVMSRLSRARGLLMQRLSEPKRKQGAA